MFAKVNGFSNLYGALFVLHILAIIVAFAPGFVNPFLHARYRKRGEAMPKSLGEILALDTMQVHGPALVLAGLFGFALVGLSDKAFEFSQPWVSIALVLWFIMLAIVFALLLPAERKMASAGDGAGGTNAAAQRVTMFGGMMHLLLLLMVIDMVFKPGWPS